VTWWLNLLGSFHNRSFPPLTLSFFKSYHFLEALGHHPLGTIVFFLFLFLVGLGFELGA
jgi:hypothetical protein